MHQPLLVAGLRLRLVFLLSRWRPMSVTAGKKYAWVWRLYVSRLLEKHLLVSLPCPESNWAFQVYASRCFPRDRISTAIRESRVQSRCLHTGYSNSRILPNIILNHRKQFKSIEYKRFIANISNFRKHYGEMHIC